MALNDSSAAPETNDSNERFTAAGGPMPKQNRSGLDSDNALGSGSMVSTYSTNTLPFKFKDSDFISVAVPQAEIDEVLGANNLSPNDAVSIAGSEAPLVTTSEVGSSRRKSFLSSLGKKGLGSSKGTSDKSRSNKKGSFKMVKITRAEYLKYFAKDDKGAYAGSAPEGDPGRKEVLRMRLADEDLQSRGRQDTIKVGFQDLTLASALTIS